MTVAHVYTVAFQGIEAREVNMQVHIAEGGNGLIIIVGLADKAVGESAKGCVPRCRPSVWRCPTRSASE